jgi:hypothetical protein
MGHARTESRVWDSSDAVQTLCEVKPQIMKILGVE